MKNPASKHDKIWKALGDGTRRQILDVLAERPLTTGEIVSRFEHLCRTNVMKHLDVLVTANLVIVRRQGRTRWNHLNPVPIQAIYRRWIRPFDRLSANRLLRLKAAVETN